MIQRFVIFWAVNTIVLWVAATLFPAVVRFSSVQALIVSGLIFGLVNTFVKPVIVFLTLPITVITLGLFLLVVNGAILLFVAWLVPGFSVAGFWPGVLVAFFVALLGLILNRLLGR